MSAETQPWRTFSFFISSTFADMQTERDHLKNIVFPKVEEDLQQHRIKLEIVDLRWEWTPLHEPLPFGAPQSFKGLIWMKFGQ